MLDCPVMLYTDLDLAPWNVLTVAIQLVATSKVFNSPDSRTATYLQWIARRLIVMRPDAIVKSCVTTRVTKCYSCVSLFGSW
jgi:hypothetical protein